MLKLLGNPLKITENTWKKYFLVGFLFFLTYFLHWSTIYQSILFILFSLTSTVLIFTGIHNFHPKPHLAWVLIGMGQCFNLLGDITYKIDYYFPLNPAYFTIPNISYIFGMVSFFCGIFWLFFKLRKHIQKIHVVYGVISAVGLFAFLWITIISPRLFSTQFSINWVELILFPAGLLIIGVLASIFLMTPLGDTWSYRFLFAVIILNAIALNFYNVKEVQSSLLDMNSTNWTGILNDATYSLAYLLMGIAFIHPSIKTITGDVPETERQISRQDMLILGFAFFLSPLGLLIKDANKLNHDFLIVMGAMLIIFTLIEWRLATVVRLLELQNSHLFSQRSKFEYQALHDMLTGLPNRLNFSKYLSDLRKRRELSNFPVAVLLIDLNKFKQVNDLFGHDKGDRVLKEISTKLSTFSRRGDFMGRWGGDEFLLILEDTTSSDALAFARRLYQDVRVHVKSGKTQFDVDISIGICMILEKQIDLSSIINQSDIALYQAKALQEDRIAIYMPENQII